MQPATPRPVSATADRSVTLRRVRGAVADELHLLVRPEQASGNATSQAEQAYAALARALHREGASAQTLVTEQIFLRPVAADFAAVAAARRLAFAAGPSRGDAATTFIGQAPLERDGAVVEIAAVAIVPRGNDSTFLPDAHCAASCACTTCAPGLHGRVLQLGTQTHLHAASIHGRGGDAQAEAFAMFVEAERLLHAAGMTFSNVIRTWIHLRDIDRDYAALNAARREFFASRGIARRPASTGVQGIPFADDHDFSLGLFAVKAPRPLDVPQMSTPALNEAWTYGADFSRGLRLDDGNKVALIVSGTASIDERGLSVHDGDFDAQARRMLHNIETLLAEQGAGFGDLASAIAYVKNPGDAPALRRLFDASGFGGFPVAVVEAPLCRPELLCETEAVAVLPPAVGA